MFNTLEVENIYRQSTPSIRKVVNFLNNLKFRESKEEVGHLKNEFTISKKECHSNQNEVLNEFYVLGKYIDMLSSYSNLWEKIVNREFASSWDSLQDALDLLRTVKKFSNKNANQVIDFFENQLQELEKLYPYNIFFSTGITVEWFECSVCGKDIDSFDCLHAIGELYQGKMAYGVARNIIEIDHISVVRHPEDKRCVVQYNNNEDQFKVVHFLSKLLLSGKIKLSDFGELRFSKKRIKNPDFQKLGRNYPCYCGSGKKFKKCCISQEFTNGDHVDIITKPTSIDEIIDYQ